MKMLRYIAVSLLVVSCKSKTVTVDKSTEKEKETLSRYFDSLIQQSINYQFEWKKHQLSVTDNLKLSSIAELDSLGNRKPFHYKHYVDGQLKEEIYLEGGEINKEKTSNKSDSVEKKQEKKQENTRIEIDVGQMKKAEKATINKTKKAKTNGFQLGFYVWLFMLIIALVILNWIVKRLKLPDKLKALLGNKGG